MFSFLLLCRLVSDVSLLMYECSYPIGVDPSTCSLSHIRPIIRIEAGQALWVAYRIYRALTAQPAVN